MNRVEFSRANRRIVRHASDEVKAWAAHRLGTDFNEPCSAFGILDRKGTLVGAAIFNDFDQRNVEVTLVGPGRFHRGIVQALFAYVFDELQCRRLSLTIRENNKAHIKLALDWGWKIEGRKRDFYDDDHAVIMGMTRAECRFLKGNDDA